jgi:serine/threonine protein phosphatase PrpC
MIRARARNVNAFKYAWQGVLRVISWLSQNRSMSSANATTLRATALRVAALTHVGQRRYSNEDCIAVGSYIRTEPMTAPWVSVLRLESPCVCLVADGMGGHPAGDVASRIAIEHLSAELPRSVADDAALVAALRDANQLLFAAMESAPAIVGMGTTIAGIAATANGVAGFNVGDSRVYRARHGELQQISIDDSVAIFSRFGVLDFPARALSQCLGGHPGADDIVPHVMREPAEANCEYLICSDGLHDMLSDDEIAACLSADLQDSVRLLFDRAMAEGGIDNISIILARLESGEDA